MKKKRKHISDIIIMIAVILIAFLFTFSVRIIEKYAEDDCFVKIEETTAQASNMFNHSLEQSGIQLVLFADILAANQSNPDELLNTYMKNFCETQNFSAVCIHRKDGSVEFYGDHPHDDVAFPSFDKEISRLPYISDAYSIGKQRNEQYVYIAVPIVRGGETIASMYGYISLDTFPVFVSSTAYGGKCQFYILDGNTGDFLMDEYHRFDKDKNEIPLSNAFDGSMGDRETKPGYSMDEMRHKIRNGEKGFHIFKSKRTGEWYYTYYMPMGINNWSMQLTIDEPTAFATFYEIRSIVLMMIIGMVVLALIIFAMLYWRSRKKRKSDAIELHKAEYLSAVQSALITAHNNPDFVAQALKQLANEVKAEKAVLLTFNSNIISDIYYWPSLDMNKVNELIGVNFREAFPVIYDAMVSNESFFCDDEMIESRFSPMAKAIFNSLSVSNILLVPVLDNTGVLKGVLCTLNMDGTVRSPEMLKMVTKDFFMAISNLENHNIIKTMGTVDYLTRVKNRNSYESEIRDYAKLDAKNLWCVFVDVNGLHAVNNTHGHKAGDLMLCTVADTIKAIFGEQYTYRIGGDEFVAFMPNSSHEDFMSYKKKITDELKKNNYFVSVGFEGMERDESKGFDIEKIVSEAESIMYHEKQKFYEGNSIQNGRASTRFFTVKKTDEQ